MRNKKGQFAYKPFKNSDFTGLIILLSFMLLGYSIWHWNDPQTLYMPLNKREFIVSKVMASELILQPYISIDDMVDGIWFLESQRGDAKIGLQEYCDGLGGWNELGWGGMAGVNGKKICFKNREEGFARVKRSITKRMDKYKSVGRTLCSYNLGDKNEQAIKGQCTYYSNFLKMRSK